MIRISTLFYRVKRMVGLECHKNADQFIANGIYEEFSPSKHSVDRIMAFSKAYHYCKTNAAGGCEQILN